MDTFHASAGRDDQKEILHQNDQISSLKYLDDFINAMPQPVLILNESRQIVFSNRVAIRDLKAKDLSEFLGKRAGEALNCIHSEECESGCGTSQSCQVCGAVNTILKSQNTRSTITGECQITGINEDSQEFYNYMVTASPLFIDGKHYTFFSLIDNTPIRRKEMMERIFFHDILNTAGNIRNLSSLVNRERNNGRMSELIKLVEKLSTELVEEIEGQKHMSRAEAGMLNIQNEIINSLMLIEGLKGQFADFPGKTDKVVIHENSDDFNFISDVGLLSRVLKNMIKNALEAIKEEEEVSVGVFCHSDLIRFRVSNPGILPEIAKKNIFRNTYSSKMEGRGYGTYSMKLLGEKYLGGKVYFENSPEGFIHFYLDLPKQIVS